MTDRMEAGGKASFTYTVTFEGVLRNVGGGPATSIRWRLMPFGQAEIEPNLPRVVAPNSVTPIHETWSAFAGGFRENGSPWPFESVVGYSTIGFTLKAGVTKQNSPSGSARDLEIEYVKPTDTDEE